jgi:hypothetical protein
MYTGKRPDPGLAYTEQPGKGVPAKTVVRKRRIDIYQLV